MIRGRLLCVALVLALTGCGIGHVRALREAEETFSRAAALENRERLNTEAPMASLGESTSGYRMAAQMIRDLMARERENLRRDNLLCTAYLVRAMSLWRLGEQDLAVQVAENAGDCAPATPTQDTTPRDRAVLHAIPGLVRVDQANALAVNQSASEIEFAKARLEIDKALRILAEAERMASNDHPVRGYLMVSRLAALRVWQVAITREKLVGAKRMDELTALNERATRTWLEYRHLVVCQLDRNVEAGVEHPSVERWRRLLGVRAPDKPVACDQPPDG